MVETFHMADGEHEAHFVGETDHLAGVFHLGVNGFLDEDVFAFPKERHHGVVMERGGDGDREGVAVVHQLVEILERLHVELFGGVRRDFRVRVVDADKVGMGRGAVQVGVEFAEDSGADDADFQFGFVSHD